MRVSIVITNHDYDRFLGEAIDSALGQSHGDTEVIVVDDGSTDGSAEVIRGYGDRVAAVMRDHGGQGAAVNAGFATSTGDAVIFMDADDVLLPDAAAEAARLLAEPGVAKAQWPMQVGDADAQPTGEIYPARPLDDGDLRDRLWTCPRYATPPQSANAYARWYLDEILPMPEPPFPAGADCYLYHLVIPFGEVRTAERSLTVYRKHAGSISAQPKHRRRARWARLDEVAWSYLAHVCRARGLPASADVWRRNSFNHRLLDAMRDLDDHLPRGEPFVLCDDNGTMDLYGEGRGELIQWWGMPDDASEAVTELERHRRAGVRHLVIAWPAYWWLAYYRGLQRHLHLHARVLVANERVRIYDLEPARSAPRRAEPGPAATVPVVMCAYQRPERLPETIAMLDEQDGCRVELHVWNNNPVIAGEVDAAVANAPMSVFVRHSDDNVGGFGRFHVAAGLRERFSRVVFVDDDVDLGPTALATLLSEHQARSIGSFHAFRFTSRDDYYARVECRPGERADYCGTGGMICDTGVFDDPALFDCPEPLRFVEDLWLCYVASHLRGWRLYRSAAAFRLHVDGHDQWKRLGDRKSAALRVLMARGWPSVRDGLADLGQASQM